MISVKDQRLILELERDSRQSYSRIGKKVGLSKTTVAYRIEKLIDANIIQRFTTTTDATKLGYKIFTMFLRLDGSSRKRKMEVVDFIKQQDDVGWCVSILGRWDIIFSTITKDDSSLQKIIRSVECEFSHCIADSQFLLNAETHAYPLWYIYQQVSEEKGAFERDSYGISSTTNLDLSENDYQVMTQLKLMPRAPIVKIAQNAKLSHDTVQRSIKKLMETKVILRVRPQINTLALGYQWNLILLSLQNWSEEERKKLLYYVQEHPNFVFLVECIGKWNLMVSVHSKNISEFTEIHSKFHDLFESVIKSEEILTVSDLGKHFFCPKKSYL